MQFSSRFRNALFVVISLAGAGLVSAASISPAHADTCGIRFKVFKAGWFIGGSGGTGTLSCGGQSYPITIGGLSAGLVFGGSETWFRGTASNVYRPSDVAGVYGAVGAGGAAVAGVQAIALRNEKGVTLHLSGTQVGLQLNLDLSGMAISLR